MRLKKSRSLFRAVILIFGLAVSLSAQTGMKVLTLDDYPRWSHIVSPVISSDGSWMIYGLRPNGGDDKLCIRNLTTDKVYEIPCGTRPAFSENSRWAAYMIGLPKAEAEKLRKEKKPVPSKAELLNLATGEKYAADNASSFSFSKDSRFLAIKKARPESEAKSGGTDLIVRNLGTGSVQNTGNVSEFGFNKPGTILAYTIDAAEKKGNGIYAMELGSGLLRTLDTGEADYSQMAWDREGGSLAVLKGIKKKELTQRENTLVAFVGLDKGPLTRIEYDPAKDPDFPKNMVISEKTVPETRRGAGEAAERKCLFWSEDRLRIFCGIKEQDREPEESKTPVANVDVWHWKEERIQSQQMLQADNDRNFTYRSVFLLNSRKFIRLTDEKMRTLVVTQNGKWGIGRDDKPYLSDLETMQADYYLVDTSTGEPKPIVNGIRRPMGDSPDSKHFLYLKDKQLWLYNIEDGKTANISKNTGVSFVNEEDDHPYEKPAYGVAGWTKDGRAVIVYHKYDLWSLPLDGGNPKNITGGMGDREEIRFRAIKLDPEERFIDSTKPLLLSAKGEWTKKSGYYSLKIGQEPRRLVYEDKSMGLPLKAKNADRVVFTMETFIDFPDYYMSGTDFANVKRITEANPQQKEYAWGSRILVDYENSKGDKLQATLTLPAGYEKGKKYPMVVYIYEKMSQRHHQYSMPTYDDRPHMSTYASDGYLFLMPDIIYTIGRPGDCALDCVRSAVNRVVELGYADPKRVGLQGHSWGGYETGFLITQTDMFACAVAGAAAANLFSDYNQVYKSTGTNNNAYHERSQGRIGTNPWKDSELYWSQSSVQQAPKINTPLLLLHGSEDGAVDWMQALEYYNAARRLGKKVIFLSYPGEPHHLGREENQKDFLVRMKQFFDHYLKGTPAPDWMENGVPFLKKKTK